MESFSILYLECLELTITQDGCLFSSLFCLERSLRNHHTTHTIDLVINGKVRPTLPILYDDVAIHHWYSVYALLPPSEVITDVMLSIKNADGLEVGLWRIYEKIEELTPHPQYPSQMEELISPTTSTLQDNALVCKNCGSNETPLWRRERMERHCNACALYLRRTKTDRKFDENRELIRRKPKKEKKSRACVECNTTSTPLWRNGRSDDGKIYCNRCGLRSAKKKVRREARWKNMTYPYRSRQRKA